MLKKYICIYFTLTMDESSVIKQINKDLNLILHAVENIKKLLQKLKNSSGTLDLKYNKFNVPSNFKIPESSASTNQFIQKVIHADEIDENYTKNKTKSKTEDLIDAINAFLSRELNAKRS